MNKQTAASSSASATANGPQPLAGVRVLDLSLLLPGPYCTWMLASFGAEVIKVEPPGGDPLRHMNPTMFGLINRGKRSVTLDLKDSLARERLLLLVDSADILVEGFRPGALDRLGLGMEALHARNPRLVVGSISGFGWSGPYRDRAAHDLNFLALAGYFAVPAQLDHRAARPQVRLADMVASQTAAFAIVMAWMQARSDGHGRHVDTSIFDAIAGWTAPMMLGVDETLLHTPEHLPHVMADSDLYSTADNRLLCLGTLEDKFWQALGKALVDVAPALSEERFAQRRGRDRHKTELAALLRNTFASRPLSFWAERLQGIDTAWAPVYEGREALSDTHMQARGFVRSDDLGQPEIRFPAQFSGAHCASLVQAPALGQDNAALLDCLETKP